MVICQRMIFVPTANGDVRSRYYTIDKWSIQVLFCLQNVTQTFTIPYLGCVLVRTRKTNVIKTWKYVLGIKLMKPRRNRERILPSRTLIELYLYIYTPPVFLDTMYFDCTRFFNTNILMSTFFMLCTIYNISTKSVSWAVCFINFQIMIIRCIVLRVSL